MDEEEKPFPIEFIIILLLIAVANDIAEIFFDLLDFTGVGIAGEAIMEPANFILDFFFTGIFWWKVGPGGATITQYFGDLLEPLLIPGRTISVGLGLWTANHPNSAIGKAAATAASIESGGATGVASEAEATAGTLEKEAAEAEKKIQSEAGSAKERKSTEAKSPEDQSDEGKENAPEEDAFKNPYENPVGTAAEELNEPPEEDFHEGKFQTQKVVDIASRRRPSPQNNNPTGNTPDDDFAEAA